MPGPCLLYYVTDRTGLAADEPNRRRLLLEKISEAASAGVDYIQLREKDLPSRDLESLAQEAVRRIAKLRTALLINSRTDVALAAQADGIHLRSIDISPEEVRRIWKERGVGALVRQPSPQAPVISVSCHTLEEVAQAARNAATFAVFAPVFEKKDARPAGLAALKAACQTTIPVLALGGITISNAHSCLEAGAAGIAAIRLFQENDIAAMVRRLS